MTSSLQSTYNTAPNWFLPLIEHEDLRCAAFLGVSQVREPDLQSKMESATRMSHDHGMLLLALLPGGTVVAALRLKMRMQSSRDGEAGEEDVQFNPMLYISRIAQAAEEESAEQCSCPAQQAVLEEIKTCRNLGADFDRFAPNAVNARPKAVSPEACLRTKTAPLNSHRTSLSSIR